MIKQYEKYKGSGVEWLDDIPEHWTIMRTTNYCIQNKKDNRELKETNLLSLSYGKIIRKDIETSFGLLPASFSSYQIVQDGYLIFRLTDLQNDKRSLRVGFCNETGIITSAYLGLIFDKRIDRKYCFYLFYNFDIKKVFYSQGGSMRQSMKFDDFKTIPMIIPPLEEQADIATYLDIKTQAIDKKINLLTKKTDYYKELRKSIINDAVCKGLDKNVKLKESEFIFPVNTNWKIYRLKDLGFLYSGLSGKAGDDFNQDDNPNNKGFIPFTNIANNTYLKANHLGTVALGENEKQNKVRKGDLFFLMSSEGYDDVGKTAVLAEDINDTYLNSFCKGYRITKKFCEPYFLNYLLLSDNYRKSLITEGKGFTRINLKMEKVTDFFVYLPSTKEEQTAIANYLDEKTQKIDAIVSNIGKQIDTLKELRKTLINDVVTGKIKVVNN
ncbi:MAG: restriction endonuclease subunit S [Candidatus Izemoplasmatales bacterium]